MSVPPAAAGPAPSVSLSYDSGSIDGRTASTNNQGSQASEGVDLSGTVRGSVDPTARAGRH
ncbi:hypothetical protein AB0L42_33870 [Streptomyces sp. NPDC052287]|uniref:hypothetical protein n=1 Tax=Streptomyces sp. NPDC052287 TaxID=3154950 RepID=UPI0034254030